MKIETKAKVTLTAEDIGTLVCAMDLFDELDRTFGKFTTDFHDAEWLCHALTTGDDNGCYSDLFEVDAEE